MNTTNEVTTTQEVATQDATTASASAKVSVAEGVWVEITRITVPEDARKHSPEDIDSRAVSLVKDGQLENILLSKEGDRLVLVYGNGRLESAKKAGWEKIRADIKEGLTESQKLMLALAENAERENESPFHTACVCQKLMETNHWTQETLAKELGKDLSMVEKYARLMKVPTEVRQTRNAFRVSLRQALVIARLTTPEDQLKVMEECAKDDLSGKALEARVKQLLNPKPAATEAPEHGSTEAQPFQFVRKGKGFTVRSLELPALDMLDVYMQDLRIALVDFLGHQREEAGTRYAA